MTPILYVKWPQEEIWGDLMLQYDLATSRDEIVQIPVRIIEWMGCDAHSNLWNENDTEIDIIFDSYIIFEGIRHGYFMPNDNGYIHYPHLLELSECFKRIHELCCEYCHDYTGFLHGDN